jgi:response regulator RpfG family c-di-GMP phosphodiesterase
VCGLSACAHALARSAWRRALFGQKQWVRTGRHLAVPYAVTPFTSILIVDDEPAVRQLMSRWVEAMGMSSYTAGSAVEALETLEARQCDVAVVDINMPGRDGLWLADELRREHPNTAVVLATGYTELLEGGIAPPVADLMLKPFSRQRFLQALDRGREWHERANAEVEWHAQLVEETQRRAIAIRNIVHEEHLRGGDEMDALRDQLAVQLPEVREHCERVGEQAASLARALELDEPSIETVARAGLLHDVGKLAIPESLLRSATRLRPGELSIVRRQADIGADILDDTTSLRDLAPVVRAIHERFGGSGLPYGLEGSAIPLMSRVVSVVDAYDAMLHNCSYRGLRDPSSAAAELLRAAPGQFDPEVVITFLLLIGRP